MSIGTSSAPPRVVPAPAALRWASHALFYAYVGLLVVAGAWGIAFAQVDMTMLLDLDTSGLGDLTRATLLSQYRFLRAMELGFGLWALLQRDAIHRSSSPNRLFLSIMAAGVVARLLSLAVDGVPTLAMLVFLGVELVGVVVIFAYTRHTLAAVRG